MGEDFAGAEKLGLAPKVLQNLWRSAFLEQAFYCVQNPKGSAEFWATFGSSAPVF